MPWYTVTKTINGHQYLYLQMTYRVGSKVKTKNKYLGPACSKGASFGFSAPANLPTAKSPSPPQRIGSPRLQKVRRLKPRTRAAMWNDANKRRLTEPYQRNKKIIKEARKNGEMETVLKFKAEQKELRSLYRLVCKRPMKIKGSR